MKIPAWVSWKGLAQHAAVGAAIAGLSWAAHAAGWLPVVLSLALGIWHETVDGDFTTEAGAPLNGLLDVFAFLPIALLYWWLHA